jgi:N-acyl-D-aspartate/D-glutamate deacylase
VHAELLIRGGTVIDGTGAPGFVADVAVIDGRIAAVGGEHTADAELDAAGCVVAPGFVDIHTHYDAQVFWDGSLTPSCWHGVTTVVAGNCGFSIAPLRAEHRAMMIETLQKVEDMSADTLAAGVNWDAFESYAEYLDAVERTGLMLNFGGYVGHTAVRLYVLGAEASDRPATTEELERMRGLVADSIAAGALGFASSAARTHTGFGGKPVPSRLGDVDEVAALVAPLREAGQGVVALSFGDPITFEDVYTVQQRAGRPTTWTPLLQMQGTDHDSRLKANTEARRAGRAVWGQTAVRPMVFEERLAAPFLMSKYPAVQRLVRLAADEQPALAADPAWRAELKAQYADSPLPAPWSTVTVGASPNQPGTVGHDLAALAREAESTPLDVLADLAIKDRMQTRISFPVANFDTAEVAKLLTSEGVLLGLGDGGAHVNQLCDACFPSELLGTWVRERGVLPLEQAVRKLTAEPADFLGLTDRGRIRVGLAADITVFDPATVTPGPLRRIADFPAGGERLVADQGQGIRHVVVNGTPIRVEGRTAECAVPPGKVLRSGPNGVAAGRG